MGVGGRRDIRFDPVRRSGLKKRFLLLLALKLFVIKARGPALNRGRPIGGDIPARHAAKNARAGRAFRVGRKIVKASEARDKSRNATKGWDV